jgi:hypothetical protein
MELFYAADICIKAVMHKNWLHYITRQATSHDSNHESSFCMLKMGTENFILKEIILYIVHMDI